MDFENNTSVEGALTSPRDDPFTVSPDALPPTVDDNVDYVSELVGEGKKFKTVADLAKAKAESDRYIAQLKSQMETKDQELNTRVSLESFLTELKSQKEDIVTEPLREDRGTPPQSTPVLDDSVIAAKVAEILQKREQTNLAAQNISAVKQALSSQFGDKAALVLHNKAQETGLTVKELQELAARSPAAFFRLTGIQGTSAPRDGNAPVIPVSSMSTEPQGNIDRGRKYYDRMRQNDPKTYASPETTSAMMRDMARMGRDRFNNS